MCLAIPAKILSIDVLTDMAMVAVDHVHKEVSLALVEDAAIGDYVLVHVGYALNKISAVEAERTLHLIGEVGAPDTTGGAAR